MSKKPTEAEVRWRVNYRYPRMRAVWLDEEAIGDPLGLAGEVRNSGAMARLALAILATSRSRRPPPAPLGG